MNSQSTVDSLSIAVLLLIIGVIGLLVWSLGRMCAAHRGVRRPLLIAALSIGGAAGYGVLRTSSGYLAGLLWAQAMFMLLLVALVSVVFTAIPRTRRSGVFGVIGVGALFVGFFAVYLGGYYLGFHAWLNDRPLPLQ